MKDQDRFFLVFYDQRKNKLFGWKKQFDIILSYIGLLVTVITVWILISIAKVEYLIVVLLNRFLAATRTSKRKKPPASLGNLSTARGFRDEIFYYCIFQAFLT